MGITVNKQDVNSFLETINEQIEYLQNQLNEQISDYEGTPWVTAVEEYTKLYKDVAAYEINTARAAKELNLFDSKSPKVDEIKSRLKKMNEVYEADQKFEQDIQDDHTGYTESQEQEVVNAVQTEVQTEPEIKEESAVQHSPEQSQGKQTEEPKIDTIEEKTKEPETPVVTQVIEETVTGESVETTEEAALEQSVDTSELDDLREAIRVKRLKNVDIEVKPERKSQRKLKKVREDLKKAGSTKEFTDEELKQQPSFKFEDNKYGKALIDVDNTVSTVYNTLIDDIVSQTTDQELARQAYYEGWVTEERLSDPNYSFTQDASIDDKAKTFLRDKTERFKRGESKPYFMEQYLDNLEENDSNKEVLALYDEIKTSRDRLVEAIFNTDDTSILDKYVEKINSNTVVLSELLNSKESQQQAEEVRKKVIDYSRTEDAQLDGIVGDTYEDNQAYILNSVKPDFITESKISFDIVDGDVRVIFNYKG